MSQKIKTLNRTEKKIINLLEYEPRNEREFIWKTKNPNPKYISLCRDRINRNIKAFQVDNYMSLYYLLNKMEREKQKKLYDKNKFDDLRKQLISDLNKEFKLKNKEISYPSKNLINKLVPHNKFKKHTKELRTFLYDYYLSLALQAIWNLKSGAQENYWFVNPNSVENSFSVNKKYDYNRYKGRYKSYPATDYTFTLNLKTNYKFKKVANLITIYNGKYNRDGMKCFWLKQSVGNNVDLVEGFLVRNYHVKKTNNINNLDKAIEYVQKIRNEQVARIKTERLYKGMSECEKQSYLKNIWITPQDSIKAGNCYPGTEQFIRQYQNHFNYGEIGAVRADELKNNNLGYNYNINKIINMKLHEYITTIVQPK